MKHEEIQRKYPNHIFTSYKGIGGSKKLVGDVIAIVFFVNDKCSAWTEDAKATFTKNHISAMQVLMDSAKAHGVHLQIRRAYADVNSPFDCSTKNYIKWSQQIIRQYGKSSLLAYQKYYTAKYGCDEAPILFAFNKPFRSFAISTNPLTHTYDELASVSCIDRQNSIIHELLHPFGARDLYFPQELKTLVSQMQYDSIMASVSSYHMDSLTAYLIGWTDEIDEKAVKILEQMKHHTHESLSKAIAEEWARK